MDPPQDNRPQSQASYTSHLLRNAGSEYAGVDNLANHPQASSSLDGITAVLKARFLNDLHYTYLHPQVLLAVNPNKDNHDANHQLFDYAAEYRHTGDEFGLETRSTLPPHIFQHAARAYLYMRRTRSDQSILFQGPAGAGKSETARLAVKALLQLSTSPSTPSKQSKSAKVASKIPAAQFILDSFGHASSLTNADASRFIRYSELQFSDKGKLVGLKGLEYHLDVSRVAGPPPGERNFHTLHYLAAGASQDERHHLRLDYPETLAYLSTSRGSNQAADAAKFSVLKQAFKTLSFPKKAVASICSLLSAILHLGQVGFTMDRGENSETAFVANKEVLEVVADFLGVRGDQLEEALCSRTVMLRNDMTTVFLDQEGATNHRDDLAKALYALLFEWLGEYMNQKLCSDEVSTFIAMLDVPNLQTMRSTRAESNNLDTLAYNLANERLHNFVQISLFEGSKQELISEQVESTGLAQDYRSNSETLKILTNVPGGIVHIIDDQSVRHGKSERTMLDAIGKRWGNKQNFTWRKDEDPGSGRAGLFSVTHWDGEVTYSTEGFLERNTSSISASLVALLGGTPIASFGKQRNSNERSEITGGSSSPFIREIFAHEVHRRAAKPGTEEASLVRRPTRKPSTKRPQVECKTTDPDDNPLATRDQKIDSSKSCFLGTFNADLGMLFETLKETRQHFVFCLYPNPMSLPNQVDNKTIKSQLRAMDVLELARRLENAWTVSLGHKEWWQRYSASTRLKETAKKGASSVWTAKFEMVKEELSWTDAQLMVGKRKVFMSDDAFRQAEDFLRVNDQEEQKQKREHAEAILSNDPDIYSPHYRGAITEDPFSDRQRAQAQTPGFSDYAREYAATPSTAHLPFSDDLAPPKALDYDDDRKSSFTDIHSKYETQTELGEGAYQPSLNMFTNPSEKDINKSDAHLVQEEETVEVYKTTRGRKQWVFLTWLFTWWIPSFMLSWVGRMKRQDVRMAWREKFTIFTLIMLLCGAAIFVIAILGNLICPRAYIYSSSELASHSYNVNSGNELTAIRGEVFNLNSFAQVHYPSIISTRSVLKYGGSISSNLFPVQVSALCNGVTGSVSPWVTLPDTAADADTNAVYHDFRAYTNDSRPDWYWEQMVYLRSRFRVGFMGLTPGEVSKRASDTATKNTVIYRGGVYDMTAYIINNGGGVKSPYNTQAPTDTDRQFMSGDIVSLFQGFAGQDITNRLDSLNINSGLLNAQRTCLRNLFYIGKVDHRNSPQCVFSRYILLAFSIVMIIIIGFKFLAALQFGKSRQPEDHDRFVVCQVPCYTEGEDSLRECFQSLASLRYADTRKLILVICDGMIVGSGNDRPTPRIVLDIFGHDPAADPPALSFKSLGNGAKQHNCAKVYSGLYEHAGHVVPYLVVVKVGTPAERSRPGNRGKRDSQMLAMRFFNRVHYDAPMSPMELEMYHQIKNVIGVQPLFYEFLFAIDADTVVDPMSVNYMISDMAKDRKIIGICGETELANSKKSIICMIQVYEYFISHHLAKAFESLFGTVTCLPGCFSMYRLRSSEAKPIFVSNDVITAFGENRVDTLHLKNLLHLGEDRYLTTLLLKFFPQTKLTFCRDAHAKTIAPEEWKVLLSQRRRWINSTIHNLVELIGRVDRLCGFLCCSMRAIVLVDLLSTLIAPVTVAYLVYLIYLVTAQGQAVPVTALIMLGAIYGLQALIFILRRRFDMVVWMLIYIAAIPVFNFFLPIYAFWKQDDFSWGNTRVVLGEKGKKLVIHEEGTFDESEIPLKSWQEYENELWEKGSNRSIGEILAAKQRNNFGSGDSVYGAESQIMPYGGAQQRYVPHSPAASTSFMMHSRQQSMQSLMGHNRAGSSFPMDRAASSMSGFHASPSNLGLSAQNSPRGGGSGESFMMVDSPSQTSFQPSSPQAQNAEVIGPLLETDIRNILATADLSTITKKAVRKQLEQKYGDLTAYKAFISSEIDRALAV